MIPILYEAGTTKYKTQGLGRLTDAISCNVIEERNGTYELSMTYPISGIHYEELSVDRIIYAQPSDGSRNQPFRIYKISRPISGHVVVSAEHISYLLSSAIAMPFKAGSIAATFAALPNYIVGADEFTFWTNKTTEGDFEIDLPKDVRTVLGGSSGSILDTYGTGEYEFDGFDVKLHLHRGNDNGVVIRYGKNLTDATRESDMSNVYTGIVPYATNKSSEATVLLSEKVVDSEHIKDYANPRYKAVDFTGEFESDEEITEDKLREKAKEYVKNNEGWEVSDSTTLSFVALWQTNEYKNTASIERVNLCDTVHVLYEDLGINVTAKVIKTDYDVLAERYNSIEVGNSTTNLSKTINSAISDATSDLQDEMSGFPAAWKKAVEDATAQITGGLGGNMFITLNADGEPVEWGFMDTTSVETAKNVWRWNLGGLGHSHNGYNGPFDDVAITQDGKINASMITTGSLDANIIKVGVIADYAGSFYLDMVTGELRMKNGTLEEMDIISGTDTDKIEIKEGAITGYKNDVQQARLEITDGAFNIIGNLQINGRQGVTGTLKSVADIRVTNHTLVTDVSFLTTGHSVVTGYSLTGNQYLSGGGVTTTTAIITTSNGNFTSYTTVVTGVHYSSPTLSGSYGLSPQTTVLQIPSGILKQTATVSEVSVNTQLHSYAYGLMMS